MGTFSIWHWLVVLLVVLLLFGSGKISGLMGDLATGIKSFKKNMKEDDASMADSAPPAPGSQPTGSISGPAGGHTTATHGATTSTGSRPAA